MLVDAGVTDPGPLTVDRLLTTLALPEGAIHLPDFKIGGANLWMLNRALAMGGLEVSNGSKEMLRSSDFTTLPEQQDISLVRVRLSDLGLTHSSTLSEILKVAGAFGLEECPAEVGPHLRLIYDQPKNDTLSVAMRPLTLSNDDPYIFNLRQFWSWNILDSLRAHPDDGWDPESGFVFSLSKSEA